MPITIPPVLTSGRKPWALLALAVIVIVAVVIAIKATSSHATARCQGMFVPAYFYAAGEWARADDSKPPPSTMILDISGVGAGTAPVPHFQSLVKKAQAAGVTVLGYSSTDEGERPASEIEQDVRDYKAWYGVTDIFLDRVSGDSPQLGYYRRLDNYIHGYTKGSVVWLNPGDYPTDPQYMSAGNVLMVFEGTYAQYLGVHVPGWAARYPAARFANTIYDTSGSELSKAISLAESRRVEHVYVTNLSGTDPYSALPSYWPREVSAVAAACATGALGGSPAGGAAAGGSPGGGSGGGQ